MATLIDITAPAEQEEGTFSILKTWLKHVGDPVTEHEPVVELETDKVALEVAAPAAGIIAEICKKEDEEVAPGEVLARLKPGAAGRASPKGNGKAAKSAKVLGRDVTTAGGDEFETRLSPAVRRLVKENALDPAQIAGTGRGGRLTREDVVGFLENAPPTVKARAHLKGEAQARPGSGGVPSIRRPLDAMRRQIAAHMVKSVTVAPHVTALFEADLSAITAHRAANKGKFAKDGVNLTYTAYFVAAAAAAMEAVPEVNSRLHDDALEIFTDVNIGVGTALGDKGLIVPVIHKAQELDLKTIAARLQDLTGRAKANTLTKADISGGTFSISNHGVSGSLLAAPIIINQPQSAILGVGKMEKRAVVRPVKGADAVVIRPMAYVTLTIDHRVLDAHQCNAWLTKFVEAIEAWA